MEIRATTKEPLLTITWYGFPGRMVSLAALFAILAFHIYVFLNNGRLLFYESIHPFGVLAILVELIFVFGFTLNVLRSRSVTISRNNDLILVRAYFAGIATSNSSHLLKSAKAIHIHEIPISGFSIYQVILLDTNYRIISIFGMFARRNKALAAAKKIQEFVGMKQN